MRSLLLKRIMDFTGAATLLVLAAPVMLVTALLIRWKMGSPVLFRQVRPGWKGRLLTLNKFRTMRNTVEPDGSPLPDNQRLTRLGRFLRATSLDELPELWNVLKGEMSLVGPRPLLIEHLDLYTAEQRRRHDVKPGLTGWAQINGRDTLCWEKKLALDVWYVDNWNLWLDVKILCLTVWTVFGRQGVIHPEDATMNEFLRSRGGVEAGRSRRPATLNADGESRRGAA